MIQENADKTVLEDIKIFLNEIAPQKNYLHNTEGPDDMPAHLKSMLTQTNLTLSIVDKSIILGIWYRSFSALHRFGRKKRSISSFDRRLIWCYFQALYDFGKALPNFRLRNIDSKFYNREMIVGKKGTWYFLFVIIVLMLRLLLKN